MSARPAAWLAWIVALSLVPSAVVAAPARGSPGAAIAGGREAVVVLPISVQGGPADHLSRSLEDRVAAGLRRGGFTPIAADTVRARVPAGECAAACLQGVVAGTGARHAVRVDVAVEGRDYNVQVVLVRVDTGAAVVTSADHCEICGHEELGERVGDLASGLQRGLAAVAAPPRLRVLTRPDGSTVIVDGAVVGVTPLDIDVAAGEHDVVVERPGYVTQRRRISAVDGVTATLADPLGPVPAPADPPASRKTRRLAPIGWATLGVGAAAFIGGAALVTLDERPIRRDCSGADVDADGDCRWRHDTLAGGAALMVVGVAALVTGAVLVALDRRNRRSSARRATIRPHATGLVVRF